MAENTVTILVLLEWAFLTYFVVVNSFYAFLPVAAVWELNQHALSVRGESYWRVLGRPRAEHQRASTGLQRGRRHRGKCPRTAALYYPSLKIVVVNDGSTDDTLAVLKENFDLAPVNPLHKKQLETKPVKAMYRSRGHPILVVVDKENGGKADSLNAGLSLASGELICAIDADTPIEPDGLQLMVRPFLAEDDVIAAGRTIRVVNGAQVKDGRVVRSRAPRKPLPGFQVVEYLRAFLFGRVGRNRLGGNLVISGAFALFLRERMIEAGGYESDSVGEGMELIMRLRRRGHEGNDPEVSNLFPIRWRGPRCPSP